MLGEWREICCIKNQLTALQEGSNPTPPRPQFPRTFPPGASVSLTSPSPFADCPKFLTQDPILMRQGAPSDPPMPRAGPSAKHPPHRDHILLPRFGGEGTMAVGRMHPGSIRRDGDVSKLPRSRQPQGKVEVLAIKHPFIESSHLFQTSPRNQRHEDTRPIIDSNILQQRTRAHRQAGSESRRLLKTQRIHL